jgi:putative ABC transport system permease protein
VMPPRFAFPEFAAIWLPIGGETAITGTTERGIGTVGRLRAGVSAAQASAEMESISARLAAQDSATYHGWTARVGPLKPNISNDTSGQAFLLALGASGFVLLIACANLANLFLVRATARARELAVRVALGASRGRIAGHLLAESLLLGLAGGAVGLLLSFWGVRYVSGLINSAMPFWIHLGTDWRFLLYTLLVSLVVGLGFGLGPAFRATRIDLNETLKTGAVGVTAGRRDGRMRGALAVAQIALAIVLLAGAGLMIKSFLLESRTEGLGYNPHGVLTARIQLAAPRYQDPAQVRLLEEQLLERLRVQPMVEAAAIERPIFLNAFIGRATRVRLESAAEPVPMGQGPGHGNAVSADYFRVMEVPMASGRAIASSDVPSAPPVVVVNEKTASLYWPGAQPLGKRLRIDSDGPWLTVVGVARDISNHPLGRGAIALLYTSLAQDSSRPFRLMIRFHGDPVTAAATLKAVARTVDPDEPVEDVLTLDADLAQQVSPVRFMALLLGALGAIALGLAALGIYGTMSYLVTRRTRELGIRMALGADGAGLRRYVVGRGLRLALFGLALGIPAALGLTRVMRSLLFSVNPGDPLVFGAVAVLLAGMSALASWRPAQRATRVDPLIALRAD